MGQIQLSQLERAYFIRKLGGTIPPTRPLNDIKRQYFISQVADFGPQESLESLEKKWLRSIIGAASPFYDSELWRRAVIAIGGTPTKNINQNRVLFYSTAP